MKIYKPPRPAVIDTKPYAKLRGELYAMDIDQRYLAELIHRSIWYIVERLSGRQPWDMDDMYMLMHIINKPSYMLHEYFPLDSRKQA